MTSRSRLLLVFAQVAVLVVTSCSRTEEHVEGEVSEVTGSYGDVQFSDRNRACALAIMIDLTRVDSIDDESLRTWMVSIVGEEFRESSGGVQVQLMSIGGQSEGGHQRIVFDEILPQGRTATGADVAKSQELAASAGRFNEAWVDLVASDVGRNRGTQLIRGVSTVVGNIHKGCDNSEIHILSDMFEQSDLLNADSNRAYLDALEANEVEVIVSRLEAERRAIEVVGLATVYVYDIGEESIKNDEESDDHGFAARAFWEELGRQFGFRVVWRHTLNTPNATHDSSR